MAAGSTGFGFGYKELSAISQYPEHCSNMRFRRDLEAERLGGTH
jgi:hypothetical protein